MKTSDFKKLRILGWCLFGASFLDGMLLCAAGGWNIIGGLVMGGVAIAILFQIRHSERFEQQSEVAHFWVGEMKRILQETQTADPARMEQLDGQFRVASHRANKEIESLGEI